MRLLMVLLCLLLSLVSCKKEGSDTIRIALSQEPVTTDIMVNTSLSGRLIFLGNVYEKLLVLDEEGNIRPELAEEWRLSEDGKELEFRIRKGVLFHDGTEMDGEDVAFSMNRWLEKYGKAGEMVGDERFLSDGDLVYIKGENNLTFLPFLVASSPQAAIIVPKEAEEENFLLYRAPGTGPYTLEEWSSGHRILLSAFPSYSSYGSGNSGVWGEKKVVTPNLEFLFVPDSTTRLLGLKSGEYDFINDLMSDHRATVEDDSSLEIVEGEESGLIALVFNKKEGVMSDRTVRQAVSLALDPDELMKSCYGDYGYSLHPDYMEKEMTEWLTGEENPYYGLDRNKAEALLSSSLYSGETVRILTSNLSNMEKIAYAAESELEKVGFSVETIVTDWAGMMEMRTDEKGWDIFISAFSKVPLPQMKSFLSPTYPGWTEEESEAYQLFLALNNARDTEEAQERWKEAEKAMWAYIPAYIPGHYTTSYAKSVKLKDVIVSDGFHFWNAYVEK